MLGMDGMDGEAALPMVDAVPLPAPVDPTPIIIGIDMGMDMGIDIPIPIPAAGIAAFIPAAVDGELSAV